jgi:hypothetical protein
MDGTPWLIESNGILSEIVSHLCLVNPSLTLCYLYGNAESNPTINNFTTVTKKNQEGNKSKAKQELKRTPNKESMLTLPKWNASD